jgi:RNA polymerase sigma-70 factor (family 1)
MQKQDFKNDAEALIKMAEGDMTAYRFLFYRHFTDLCNFLLIYLHSKELSEEIALEIFTFVWEKRESLQIKVSFKSFLFASAKNKAISYYRKEQKRIFSLFDAKQSLSLEDAYSQNFLENNELRELINSAVGKLPDKSRQIYLLAWEENLSYKEIAEQMGITTKTVENHIGIALRKLRETLNPYYKQIFLLLIAGELFNT